MRRSKGAVFIGLALLTQATVAVALGFGRIGSSTTLGQPLDFSVVLTADGNESLTPPCVAAEVLIGDNPLPSTQVRIRLDQPADGGPAVLHVMTQVRIDEPVASVNVTVGCPARLSRKFVVFIDPPVLAAPPTVASPAAPSPVASVAAAEAASTGGSRAAAPAQADVDGAPRAAGGPAGRDGVPPSRAAAQAEARNRPALRAPRPAAARRVAAVEPRRSGLATPRAGALSAARGGAMVAPRLKLEADLQPYRSSASATVAADVGATAPVTSATAAASGTASAAEEDQQRIRQLEQSIQTLLTEAQATRSTLADLQLRLREAESARFFNPWTYALLALVALLLAVVAWLIAQQSRLKRESVWWAGGTEADATAAAVTPPADPAPGIAPSEQGAADEPSVVPTVAAVDTPVSPAAAPQRFVVAGAARDEPKPDRRPFDPLVTAVGDQVHDMSVDELIDMEQQVEFFIVLGQDDAAIDLLMGHVRQGGNSSPLAFLKLLDIYRRRGEREPYEQVRERFNRRFNARAPDWEAGTGGGHSLEAYPTVAASLQAVWHDPQQAMALLESLLFRRDASAGTFDLPAYAELLFLYSQARDLAEHDIPTDTVDLLLPIGEEPATFTLTTATEPAPLGTTAVAAASASVLSRPLPFDVTTPSTSPLQPAGATLSLTKPASLQPPAAGPAVASRQPAAIDFDLDDFDVPAPAARR